MRMSPENNLEFLREGLTNYMDAMLALKQFRTEIEKRSRSVLRDNLTALAQALHRTLESDPFYVYVNPELGSANFNGKWTWITTGLKVKGLSWALFGLL